jgi:hypothetical protein
LTDGPGKDDPVYANSVRQGGRSLNHQFDRDALILPIADMLSFFDASD